ncbi:hypothetical protein I6N90_00220 [Paenibacillus sp. GSMTC-2017]|uniref:hypothetical protein n=1 Tax=Paenibacillus sp. GSMTC-2017 TaxID=2794350 RepID=UPI0018D86435|nr:hypothetical protein [Paenibacillus sp. GSMTC-2017]MBH5316232.1 hypothetical protein [Paenibacillus sp. GSMTC-2017]
MKYEVFLLNESKETYGRKKDWMELGVIETEWKVLSGDSLLLDESIQEKVTVEFPRLHQQTFYKVDKVITVPDDETLEILIVRSS